MKSTNLPVNKVCIFVQLYEIFICLIFGLISIDLR